MRLIRNTGLHMAPPFSNRSWRALGLNHLLASCSDHLLRISVTGSPGRRIETYQVLPSLWEELEYDLGVREFRVLHVEGESWFDITQWAEGASDSVLALLMTPRPATERKA